MFQAMEDDLFMLRLQQIAWEKFSEKKLSISDPGQIMAHLSIIFEEFGLRDVSIPFCNYF